MEPFQAPLFDASPTVFGWKDLFPSYDNPYLIDHRLIQLVRLCGETGLPFPAERNHAYSVWWHSLHEIGHWAVKPPWYIAYSSWMRDDITIRAGTLRIPAGTIVGLGAIEIENFSVYGAGNDLIPDIGLLHDPTPGEHETRVWSLRMIQRYGWPHPFEENTVGGKTAITRGDAAFHKACSARVWFRLQMHDPVIARSMDQWGIDPLRGAYRAKDDGFALPHPVPSNMRHLVVNMDAIYRRYDPTALTLAEREAWVNDYLFPRYAKYLNS